MSATVSISGGCHCGAVRYEAQAPSVADVEDCNCTICAKSGYLHLIVPDRDFRLVRGESTLIDYRFNTGAALHRFCSICGVKSFYTPRSNPDGVSINLRCVDDRSVFEAIHIRPFNGLGDWDAEAKAIAHKSVSD